MLVTSHEDAIQQRHGQQKHHAHNYKKILQNEVKKMLNRTVAEGRQQNRYRTQTDCVETKKEDTN